jgi:hypothetical protein
MGHNFHVEWHFKFEVEIGIKPWSTPLAPVHQRHKKSQVSQQFMRNLLLKTPMSLSRSYRGLMRCTTLVYISWSTLVAKI